MITWLFLIFLFVLVLVVGAFLIAAYATLKHDIGKQVKMVEGKVGDVRGEVRTLGTVSEAELDRLKAVDLRQDALHASTTKMFKTELRRVDDGMAKLVEKDTGLDASLSTVRQQIQGIEARYVQVRATITANMKRLKQLDRDGVRNKEAIVKIADFLYKAARQADELMGLLESIFDDFERRIVAVEGADLPRKLAELAHRIASVDANAMKAMQDVAARLDKHDRLADPAIELRKHASIIEALRTRLKKVEDARAPSKVVAELNSVRARLVNIETRTSKINAMEDRLEKLKGQVANAQADAQKTINSLKVSKLQLGDKWSLSGSGDGKGSDEWLRLMDAGGKDYYGGFAARKLWSGEGVSVESGVDVRGNDPGPLIEKRYGGDDVFNNRYGVAQRSGGETHLYAANANAPSAVHMSFATGRDAYDSVLIAEKNKASGEKTVTVQGRVSLKSDKDKGGAANMCVDEACITGDKGDKTGRMHIHAPEKIYLLPKGGVELTADWGADPTFAVRSGGGKTGKLCIDDQCITKADLVKFKSMPQPSASANPSPAPPPSPSPAPTPSAPKNTPRKWMYNGCWKDKHFTGLPRPLQETGGRISGTTTEIRNVCGARARANGRDIFAIQDGNACMTGSTARDDYKRDGSSTDCTYMRGGPWLNSVWVYK